MTTGALYFPSIRVPETEWFGRVLLYWQRVGTIIPRHVEGEVEGEYTGGLLRAGLLQPIRPERVVMGIPDFGRSFLDAIDADEQGGEGRRQAFRAGDIQLIERAKSTSDVLDRLCDLGLAAPPAEDSWPQWFSVERSTAERFMAYLAVVLGAAPHINMTPVTDSPTALRALTGSQAHEDTFDAARIALLDVTLPALPTGVPPEELAHFIARHGKAQATFRNRIERAVLEIAREPDEDLRRRRLALAQDEFEAEGAVVRERLAERGWNADPLDCVLRIATPAGPAAAAMFSGRPALAAASVPGLLLGAYMAGRRQRRAAMSHPLVYAALAEKRFATDEPGASAN